MTGLYSHTPDKIVSVWLRRLRLWEAAEGAMPPVALAGMSLLMDLQTLAFCVSPAFHYTEPIVQKLVLIVASAWMPVWSTEFFVPAPFAVVASCVFFFSCMTALLSFGGVYLVRGSDEGDFVLTFVISRAWHALRTWLYLPLLHVLLATLPCDGGHVAHFGDTQCRGALHLSTTICGVLAATLLAAGTTALTALLGGPASPSQRTAWARAHNRGDLVRHLAVTMLVVLYHLLVPAGFFILYNCAALLCALVIVTQTCLTLPYTQQAANERRAAVCTSVAFVAIINIITSAQGDWFADQHMNAFLLVTMTPFLFTFGSVLAGARCSSELDGKIDHLLHSGHVPFHMALFPLQRGQMSQDRSLGDARFASLEKDLLDRAESDDSDGHVQALALSAIVVPTVNQLWFPSDVEVACRFIRHAFDRAQVPPSPYAIAFATRIFSKAMLLWGHSPTVRVAFADFLLSVGSHQSLALEISEQVELQQSREYNLLDVYAAHRVCSQARELFGLSDDLHRESLIRARKYHKGALSDMRQFWATLTHHNPSMTELALTTSQLSVKREIALREYLRAVNAAPTDQETLTAAAAFAEQVISDGAFAEQMRAAADEVIEVRRHNMLRGSRAKLRSSAVHNVAALFSQWAHRAGVTALSNNVFSAHHLCSLMIVLSAAAIFAALRIQNISDKDAMAFTVSAGQQLSDIRLAQTLAIELNDDRGACLQRRFTSTTDASLPLPSVAACGSSTLSSRTQQLARVHEGILLRHNAMSIGSLRPPAEVFRSMIGRKLLLTNPLSVTTARLLQQASINTIIANDASNDGSAWRAPTGGWFSGAPSTISTDSTTSVIVALHQLTDILGSIARSAVLGDPISDAFSWLLSPNTDIIADSIASVVSKQVALRLTDSIVSNWTVAAVFCAAVLLLMLNFYVFASLLKSVAAVNGNLLMLFTLVPLVVQQQIVDSIDAHITSFDSLTGEHGTDEAFPDDVSDSERLPPDTENPPEDPEIIPQITSPDDDIFTPPQLMGDTDAASPLATMKSSVVKNNTKQSELRQRSSIASGFLAPILMRRLERSSLSLKPILKQAASASARRKTTLRGRRVTFDLNVQDSQPQTQALREHELDSVRIGTTVIDELEATIRQVEDESAAEQKIAREAAEAKARREEAIRDAAIDRLLFRPLRREQAFRAKRHEDVLKDQRLAMSRGLGLPIRGTFVAMLLGVLTLLVCSLSMTGILRQHHAETMDIYGRASEYVRTVHELHRYAVRFVRSGALSEYTAFTRVVADPEFPRQLTRLTQREFTTTQLTDEILEELQRTGYTIAVFLRDAMAMAARGNSVLVPTNRTNRALLEVRMVDVPFLAESFSATNVDESFYFQNPTWDALAAEYAHPSLATLQSAVPGTPLAALSPLGLNTSRCCRLGMWSSTRAIVHGDDWIDLAAQHVSGTYVRRRLQDLTSLLAALRPNADLIDSVASGRPVHPTTDANLSLIVTRLKNRDQLSQAGDVHFGGIAQGISDVWFWTFALSCGALAVAAAASICGILIIVSIARPYFTATGAEQPSKWPLWSRCRRAGKMMVPRDMLGLSLVVLCVVATLGVTGLTASSLELLQRPAGHDLFTQALLAVRQLDSRMREVLVLDASVALDASNATVTALGFALTTDGQDDFYAGTYNVRLAVERLVSGDVGLALDDLRSAWARATALEHISLTLLAAANFNTDAELPLPPFLPNYNLLSEPNADQDQITFTDFPSLAYSNYAADIASRRRTPSELRAMASHAVFGARGAFYLSLVVDAARSLQNDIIRGKGKAAVLGGHAQHLLRLHVAIGLASFASFVAILFFVSAFVGPRLMSSTSGDSHLSEDVFFAMPIRNFKIGTALIFLLFVTQLILAILANPLGAEVVQAIAIGYQRESLARQMLVDALTLNASAHGGHFLSVQERRSRLTEAVRVLSTLHESLYKVSAVRIYGRLDVMSAAQHAIVFGGPAPLDRLYSTWQQDVNVLVATTTIISGASDDTSASAMLQSFQSTPVFLAEVRAGVQRLNVSATTLLRTLRQSNTELENVANAAVDGTLAADAILLALITVFSVLLLRTVVVPVVRIAAEEEFGTRMLLTMIPKETKDAIPKLQMYVETGEIVGHTIEEAAHPIDPSADALIHAWASGNNAEVRDVMDTTSAALIVISDTGDVLHASAPVQPLFGYKPSELRGRNVNVLMDEPLRSQHTQFIARFVSDGNTRIIGTGGRDVVGVTKTGARVHVYLRVFELRGSASQERAFLGQLSRYNSLSQARVGTSPQTATGVSKWGQHP